MQLKLSLFVFLNILQLIITESCTHRKFSNSKCFLQCKGAQSFDISFLDSIKDCNYFSIYFTQSFTTNYSSLDSDYFFNRSNAKFIEKLSWKNEQFSNISNDFLSRLFLKQSNSLHFWSLSIINNINLCSLEPNLFQDAVFVKQLDLSYNSIADIDGATFEGLESLETLKLGHNRLQQIGQIFGSLRSLKTLDLSANEISVVNENSLSTLTELEHLILSHNRLTVLSPRLLRQQQVLQTLDLGYNRLREFNRGDGAFSGSLRSLYLSHNRLETLSEDLLDFDSHSASQTLILLSDNVWCCDERLLWMKKRRRFIELTSIKCSTPAEFRKMTVEQVTSRHLQKLAPVIDIEDAEYSYKQELTGVLVSSLCVVLLLLFIFTWYKHRWCTSRVGRNNTCGRAQYLRTSTGDADDDVEQCIIAEDKHV